MVVPQRSFRLKLEFDIPPPAFPGSSKYVILVKPDEYKTIHDLEVHIIRKFGFSSGAIASLSLDGFSLPSTEDVCVLSHDDYINVVVMREVSQKRVRKRKIRHKKPIKDEEESDDTPHIPSPKRVKLDSMRNGAMESNATRIKKPNGNGVRVHGQLLAKAKKLANLNASNLESSETDVSPAKHMDTSSTSDRNTKRKMETGVTLSDSKVTCKVGQILPDTKHTQSSETSKSVSEEKTYNASKVAPGHEHAKGTANTSGCLHRLPTESSSSESDSENKKVEVKGKDMPEGHSPTTISNSNVRNSQDDNKKNIDRTLIQRRICAYPADHARSEQSHSKEPLPPAPKATSKCGDVTSSSIHKHRNSHLVKMTKQTKTKETKGASNRNKSHITFDSSSGCDSDPEDEKFANKPTSVTKGQDLSSWLNTAKDCIKNPKQTWVAKTVNDPGVSTNLSSIYVNPELSDQLQDNCLGKAGGISRPKRDYPSLSPLTWPPQVGDIFAYKILEMSENYCPVISEYKEVKVQKVLFAQSSPIRVNAIQVQRLWPKSSVMREGGRFEMVFEDEQVESKEDDVVTLEWKMLLEPKLIDRNTS